MQNVTIPGSRHALRLQFKLLFRRPAPSTPSGPAPRRQRANLTPLPFQQTALDLPQTNMDNGQTNEYPRPVVPYNKSTMGLITCSAIEYYGFRPLAN
jgi:hypothetical protein